MPTILISTWDNGVFRITGNTIHHELAGQTVRSLADDGRGGVLAIVGAHALRRRAANGEWTDIATSQSDLSCCMAVGNAIFAGTDDAQILCCDAQGALQRLPGFAAVQGRDTWYAGTAIVDGKVMGPPLGIRSLSATCDGVLLANVHVGGIPRSTDGGQTWQPTIDVEADVHQVCAHPARPELVIAAAAVGLCISRDAGATWTIEQRGLHAPHCSAVAFGRNDIFVSASVDPFSQQGAVYRRPIDGDGPLAPVGGSMPRWTAGRADTDCIATRESTVAVIDGAGNLYVSGDDGATWTTPAGPIPSPSGLHIC
ncbi:MAG TPA: hypothetical protein VH000_06565 [Rhizomicrobium sp.]|jgi:photosystem II stability/assembly factor-like uncharacterized protein|nr:hypothetical protein [Rhizomicrobium sp.]